MNDKLKIIELLKQQVAAKTAELTPKNIQKITQDIQDLLKILNDVVAIDFIDTTSETVRNKRIQQLQNLNLTRQLRR